MTAGTIGPYEVIDEIGRGGVGRVYRARYIPTGAIRALKVLAGAADPEAVIRFQREAEVLARVGGAGIVPVHHSGTEGGKLWFAMELFGGGSLGARLGRDGKLPWAEAARLVAKLAHALARCHAAGVIHRDVKPDNVLLDEAGEPWLADFGAVRDLAASRLTETGTSLGTLSYMSPEQLDGRPVDARTDVYALAVVLFEAISGTRPFDAQSVAAHAIARLAPRRRLAVEGAPAALDAILDRALTVDLARRTPSTTALARELEDLLRARSPVKPRGPQPRRPFRVLGGLVLASLALVGAALVATGKREAPATGVPPVERPAIEPAPAPSAAELEARGDAALLAGKFEDARAAFRQALELGQASSRKRSLVAAALLDPRTVVKLADVVAVRSGSEELRPFAPALYRRGLEVPVDLGLRLHDLAWKLDEPPPELRSKLAASWRAFADFGSPDESWIQDWRRLGPGKAQRMGDRIIWGWRAHTIDPGGDPAAFWGQLEELRDFGAVSTVFQDALHEILGDVAEAEHPTLCLIESKRHRRDGDVGAGHEWALRGIEVLPPHAAGESAEVGALATALVDQLFELLSLIDGGVPARMLVDVASANEHAPSEDHCLGLARLFLRNRPPDLPAARAWIERVRPDVPPSDGFASLEVEILEASHELGAALDRARRWAIDRPGVRSHEGVLRILVALRRWDEVLAAFDVKLDDGVSPVSQTCLSHRLRALFQTGRKSEAADLAKKFPFLGPHLQHMRPDRD